MERPAEFIAEPAQDLACPAVVNPDLHDGDDLRRVALEPDQFVRGAGVGRAFEDDVVFDTVPVVLREEGLQAVHRSGVLRVVEPEMDEDLERACGLHHRCDGSLRPAIARNSVTNPAVFRSGCSSFRTRRGRTST